MLNMATLWTNTITLTNPLNSNKFNLPRVFRKILSYKTVYFQHHIIKKKN